MQTHRIVATTYKEKLERWRPSVDPTAYARWRRAVLRANPHICALCGQPLPTRRIQVDHIQPYETHPELVFVVSNGRILCRICHAAHHDRPTAGMRARVLSGIRGGKRAASVQRLQRAQAGYDRLLARRAIQRSA